MESTISTKDLKSKLDQKQVTVVETLAPECYREAHIPGAHRGVGVKRGQR